MLTDDFLLSQLSHSHTPFLQEHPVPDGPQALGNKEKMSDVIQHDVTWAIYPQLVWQVQVLASTGIMMIYRQIQMLYPASTGPFLYEFSFHAKSFSHWQISVQTNDDRWYIYDPRKQLLMKMTNQRGHYGVNMDLVVIRSADAICHFHIHLYQCYLSDVVVDTSPFELKPNSATIIWYRFWLSISSKLIMLFLKMTGWSDRGILDPVGSLHIFIIRSQALRGFLIF
jgi:hypothetical protein